jgi:YacP-like NYN domain
MPPPRYSTSGTPTPPCREFARTDPLTDGCFPDDSVPSKHPSVRRDLRSDTGRACEPTSILVVDGNNVIGAVADGWWRDRPAAVRRLLGRLQCLGEPATLVLDVAQPDLAEGDHDSIIVRYATRRGRDAADDLIREIVADAPDVTVVTSDRALRRDVEDEGATVIGAGTFLARLDAAGC